MRPVFLLAATVATLCAFAPALAQTVLPLPRFEAVSLQGGGKVTLRHGAQQKVTILRGDPNVTRFEVDHRSLEISACENRCPRNYDLEVEIVSPNVDALAVQGGGSIEMQAGFPVRRSIALSVQGGGVLDTDAVEARQVAASVQGGGLIRTRASGSLAASVRGGGAITYRGDPSVATSIQGGGSVRPAGR